MGPAGQRRAVGSLERCGSRHAGPRCRRRRHRHLLGARGQGHAGRRARQVARHHGCRPQPAVRRCADAEGGHLGVDYTVGAWRGIAAPKNLPAPIAERYTSVLKKINESKEFRDFMSARGFGVKWADGAGFAKFMDEGNTAMGVAMKARASPAPPEPSQAADAFATAASRPPSGIILVRFNDLVTGATLIVAALFVIAMTLSFPAFPDRTTVRQSSRGCSRVAHPLRYSADDPGYGARRAGEALAEIPEWARDAANVISALLVLGAALAYIFLLDAVGFVPLTLVVLLVLFLWFRVRVPVAIATALVAAFGINWFFASLMRVPLPRGVMDWFL